MESSSSSISGTGTSKDLQMLNNSGLVDLMGVQSLLRLFQDQNYGRPFKSLLQRLQMEGTLNKEVMKANLRWLCLNDLYFLSKFLLDFWWLAWKPHKEFCNEIEKNLHLTLYLLPRGHCKTILFSIADSIRQILIDPVQVIGIGSDSSKRARKRVRVIRHHCTKNVALRNIFSDKLYDNPENESPKWTEEELIFPGHDGRQEATITAFGVNNMPTGSHFPKIKFDDLVTPENSNTDDLLRQTRDDYGMVRSSILQQEGANLQICGTIYNDADLHRDMERSGQYRIYKRPAIDPETGDCLWREQFNHAVLEAIRRDPAVGEYIFSCQYLLDPVPSEEDAFFNLIKFPEYEGWPSFFSTYAAIDFAISEEDVKQANKTCIVVAGVNLVARQIALLDVRMGKWASDRIAQEMLDVQLEWNPVLFTAEQGHINKTIGPFLKLMMKEQGITINLDPRVPVTDKVSRARTAQGLSKMEMISLPKRGANQPKWLSDIRMQLRRFPYGKDKDFIDALAWMCQAIDEVFKSKWVGVAT